MEISNARVYHDRRHCDDVDVFVLCQPELGIQGPCADRNRGAEGGNSQGAARSRHQGCAYSKASEDALVEWWYADPRVRSAFTWISNAFGMARCCAGP